ncbi:MAG: branched-chain amino acid ABC transporter permease [Planctomycetota bacterium]|mgnify:CR=1 FL=1
MGSPDTLERIGEQVLIGLTNGSVIALIALGYTMVYGIIELINFAHGDVYMLGSFLALTLLGTFGIGAAGGMSPAIGIPILFLAAAAFCALANVSVERLVYRPLRSAPKIGLLVAAIGTSFALQNLGLFWAGSPLEAFNGGTSPASPQHFRNLVGNGTAFSITEHIRVSHKSALILATTLVLLVALVLLLKRTRLGRAMRAVAQDPTAAALMGIDSNAVIRATFAVGGALAGFGAVMSALYTNNVHFQMGYTRGIEAFTAAVLGGIGNLTGAVLGGILIGLVRAMVNLTPIGNEWGDAAVFSILVAILVFRPSGLLGESVREKV